MAPPFLLQQALRCKEFDISFENNKLKTKTKNTVMFKIDLLNGRGAPAMNTPTGICIVAASCAIPIIIAIFLTLTYLDNKVAIAIQENEIKKIDGEIREMSEAVSLNQTFKEGKETMTKTLSEIEPILKKYTQWSDVLTELSNTLPGSIILTQIDVTQTIQKRTVRDENDPQKTTDISVPIRTLTMEVKGKPGVNCDKAVKVFQNSLQFSDFLKPILKDIRISQGVKNVEKKEVSFYKIVCVFEPKL